ncbi:MAG: Hpt domain-containing protein, partial [Nitrospirae bacterium]|nr:Hpt domain-containing protein [Nitrospirota bacterium]
MGSEFDQQNLVGIFVAEASDGVTALMAALHPADEHVPAPLQIQEQYIIAHRIRGAAALYGFGGVAQLSERLEALLERAPEIPDAAWPRAVGVMREIAQGIQALVQSIGQGGKEDEHVVERCLTSSEGLLPGTSGPSSPAPSASSVSREYVVPVLDDEVLSYFVPEAEEYLDTIDGLIATLHANMHDEDSTHRLFRTAHTLKGSAYTVGFQVIGDIAHPMEDCMIAVREKRIQLSADFLKAIAQAAGVVRLILRRDPVNIDRLQGDVPTVIRFLSQLCDGEAVVFPSIADVAVAHSPDMAEGSIVAQKGAVAPVEVDQPATMSDDYLVPHLDPEVLSYFAPEAQEYLETLEANLLRLDKDPHNRELINQLFRTAHTLKGSAYTVGFQAIGDLMHHVEDFMGAVRDNRLRVLPGHTDLMLRSVDVVRVLMRRDPSMVSGTRQRFAEAMSELKRLEQGGVIDVTAAHETVSRPLAREEQTTGFGEEQAQG